MGRIEHALDALRLLCTKNPAKAAVLASQLGLTNKQRQQLTEDHTAHALGGIEKLKQVGSMKKLLFVSDSSYNQGVIGLVAGRLVEQYYRPTIVLSVGDEFSKASARSVSGFNIIEAIRTATDLLVDAGGHPMAAGFTVQTKNLLALKEKLEALGEQMLTEEILTRKLHIDAEIPLSFASDDLWKAIQMLAPYGVANPEPVLASRGLTLKEIKVVGATKKHLKMVVKDEDSGKSYDAIAFGMVADFGGLEVGTKIDIAYAIDINEWNGNRKLQLKIRDIQLTN
jgi:single-stranded-DNA-specific exonuclease